MYLDFLFSSTFFPSYFKIYHQKFHFRLTYDQHGNTYMESPQKTKKRKKKKKTDYDIPNEVPVYSVSTHTQPPPYGFNIFSDMGPAQPIYNDPAYPPTYSDV